MTINKELVDRVRQFFDLNIYEAKVWIALLIHGIASASEIAETSGVPRSRCYDVLESLEKEGFVIQKIGKPVKFIAVKPEIAIERLKLKMKDELKEKIEMLEKLKETKEYEQLKEIHKSSSEPTKIKNINKIIKGKNNIITSIYEILNSAEKEIIICMPFEKFKNNEKIFKDIIEKCKKRNIEINLILSNCEKEKLTELKNKYKIKIKGTKINAEFFIVDKEQVFFIILEEKEEIGLWINSDFLSTSLSSLLEIALMK